jgi:hypothetical protein
MYVWNEKKNEEKGMTVEGCTRNCRGLELNRLRVKVGLRLSFIRHFLIY